MPVVYFTSESERKPVKVGNKTLNQRFGANLNFFLLNFAANLLLFFTFFSFFPHSKSWLKYTTVAPSTESLTSKLRHESDSENI